LVEATKWAPFVGIGKSVPLRKKRASFRSRRIDEASRLVYALDDDALTIISCRYHS